jgi:hypothetical protein
MESNRLLSSPIFLLAGDILALACVTIIGFARHGELTTAGTRMLTTFLPLIVSWLIMATLVNALNVEHAQNLPNLWRPALAAFLAAPWFGFLRGLLLWKDADLEVTLVVGGVTIIAILIWRLLFFLISRTTVNREQLSHG